MLIVELVLALVFLPWFALMALVVIAACWQRIFANRRRPEASPSTRFLVVIPAHDESSVIAITVRSCLAVAYDPKLFQVFVIADNCTDDTAGVAEAAGAHLMVRTDLDRKSKGFALDDFFRTAETNPIIRPFDAYVLVDADTSVAVDLLTRFDQSIRRGDDFVQGYYTVRNADASWRTRMMTYAFSLANGVWLAGLDQLGLSVGLKGNGMCFRAEALRRFPWQAHGLVEDMEFAWNLRIAGERVRFQPLARVYGEMVSRGGSGAASQRRRWESGRKALRAGFRAKLWRSTRLFWVKKLVYWVELEYPPLGWLAIGLALASLVGEIGRIGSGDQTGLRAVSSVLAADWLIFFIYALSPIFVMSLPIRYLLSLIYLPFYLTWKVYVGVLKQPMGWVRTPRETSSATPNRP